MLFKVLVHDTKTRTSRKTNKTTVKNAGKIDGQCKQCKMGCGTGLETGKNVCVHLRCTVVYTDGRSTVRRSL